jgi:glycosyltransferase 2 family protein
VRRLWPVAVLLLVVLLVWIFRHHIAFDPRAFARQIRQVSVRDVLLALLAIYIGFVLRATRWAILLAPVRKATTPQLIPSQFIGFTAVALFGRVADLARPYLVARRLQTPVATQLAVYSIERAFDLAAAAILFSVTLAFAPRDMPHHEAFTRAGLVSLAATLFLAAFAATIRFAGDRLARSAAALLRPASPRIADTVSGRILDFREGFRTIASFGQFAAALLVSLIIWLGIALCYLESARAFKTSPTLGNMTFTGIMLLLATSLGASLLQLPVLGWFTQIAVLAAAYRGFYGVPVETASACGTLSLITTSLSIIPAGLIASRVQGVSLRDASRSSETTEPST